MGSWNFASNVADWISSALRIQWHNNLIDRINS
jgi:hypothetical protein